MVSLKHKDIILYTSRIPMYSESLKMQKFPIFPVFVRFWDICCQKNMTNKKRAAEFLQTAHFYGIKWVYFVVTLNITFLIFSMLMKCRAHSQPCIICWLPILQYPKCPLWQAQFLTYRSARNIS